jgi:hypothetical protein
LREKLEIPESWFSQSGREIVREAFYIPLPREGI